MKFYRSIRVLTTAAAFVFALGLGTQHANAAVVFDVDTVTNGDTPAGTGPWLRATFEQTGANTVQLTMENFLSSGEFLVGWGFNVSDTILASGFNATNVSFVSGDAAEGIQVGSNVSNVNNSTKAGLFDIVFSYDNAPPSARFVGGETSVYTFTAAGLTENDFLAFSAPEPPNVAGGWLTAARLQGLPNGGSGSIGAIPEPAFYQMSGLLILGGLGALRMRKNRNRK